MLTEVEELQVAWQALSGRARDNGRETVAIGETSGRFRAGIIYPAGEETVLVGFNSDVIPQAREFPEGTGFRVETSSENFDPAWTWWLCLTRQTGGGEDLFAQMAADVMSVIGLGSKRSESILLVRMLSRIRAWQEFMQRPRSGRLTPQEEIGLAGELTVLIRLIERSSSADTVIRAWTGPSRGLQDFQSDTLGLEVKTTLSVTGFPARISSLEQLDPVAGRPVFLAAVRLLVDDQGESLLELAGRARELTGKNPKNIAALERSLTLAGYTDEDAYTRRFICKDIRVFDVEQAFPRLIRSEVRPEILAATYDIDIDLITSAPETLDETLIRFGGF